MMRENIRKSFDEGDIQQQNNNGETRCTKELNRRENIWTTATMKRKLAARGRNEEEHIYQNVARKGRAFAKRNMDEGNVYAKQKAIMEGQYRQKRPSKRGNTCKACSKEGERHQECMHRENFP